MNVVKPDTANNKLPKYLADYKPCSFAVENVSLDFSLFDSHVVVTTKMVFHKVNKRVKNLQLVGEGLKLLSLFVDGAAHDNYELGDGRLIVKQVPNEFTLSTQVEIHPESNTLLEGLYRSSNIFCTQCEAEGFRRITYFLDRPDVMTEYHVRIEADQSKYPLLLSNGNLIESGELPNGRHFSRWHDPFAKPCYLFALVAGDLAVKEKSFKTLSGRDVLLQVLTEKAFIHQADYALDALERSMRWDEETFNLEYDLDRYMVVAISDFNMGAMENKGLNIFNSKYVLATPETATDKDFLNIENIIGHEYFHNWTGNRVTCRDWFQLSLKEGLTVFRDALFSADMTTKGIKRLEEVRTVREHQFIEDQGPMSHPVRPDSYIEINNFYTLTVYEKGGEVIRMIYNLIGERNFKKGMALYFERHDGQAVTVEDFVQAMSDASGEDLTGQFFRWYTQSGTPTLHVSTSYDDSARTFKIHLKQTHQPTAGQAEKENLVIPVAYRLFNEAGESMSSENVIILKDSEKTVEFGSINTRPIVSLLRNFSSPVIVHFEQSDDDLHTLARYDDDLFVRFDAVHLLLKRLVSTALNEQPTDDTTQAIANTLIHIVEDTHTPLAEKAELLTFPSLAVFFDTMSPIDVSRLASVVNTIRTQLVTHMSDALRNVLKQPKRFTADDLSFDAIAERSFHNTCLTSLSILKDDETLSLATTAFEQATVMTNQLAALSVINQVQGDTRDAALNAFYERFKNDPQVIDKWLAIQANADFDNTIEMVEALAQHEAFAITNPNKVRALYGTFCMQNITQFHHESGKGYAMLAALVKQLDDINPSIASRMIRPLTQWQRFADKHAKPMQNHLAELLKKPKISKDLYEIVSKSLV